MDVTVLSKPKGQTITIPDLPAKAGTVITQLGGSGNLAGNGQSGNVQIAVPGTLAGDYAYSFKLAGYAAP